MHPELYYVLHQQRERELEASLRHRRASEERAQTCHARRDATGRRTDVLTWLTRRVRAARPTPGAVVGTAARR